MPLVPAVGALVAGAGGTAAVASAAIGAGATLYAANQQSRAANQAMNAQQQATNQANALQQQQFDRVQQNNQPFMQGGYASLDALLAEFGLTPQNAQGQTAQQQPDFNAYLQANPDVAAEYQQEAQMGTLAQMGISSPEQFAQWHYNTYGQSEGRTLPTVGGDALGTDPPQSGQTSLQMQIDALGGRPDMQRPDYITAEYVAPPSEDQYFSNFEQSPGYQFLLDEAMRNTNVARYSRGVGSSGGTMRELQNRAVGLAAQDYNNWFNRQNALYQSAIGNANFATNFNLANAQQQNALRQGGFESDRLYGNANFDADRNFLVSENQRRVGNLMGLAGMGQNAAAGVNSAGANMASNIGNQLNTNANALAAGYGQIADARASGLNALAGMGQSLLTGIGANNLGSGGVPRSTGNKNKTGFVNYNLG